MLFIVKKGGIVLFFRQIYLFLQTKKMFLKKFKIKNLLASFLLSLKRFPTAYFYALTFFISSEYLILTDWNDNIDVKFWLLMINYSLWAIIFAILIKIFSEKKGIKKYNFIGNIILVFVVVGLFAATYNLSENMIYYKVAIIDLISFLMMFFLPFVASNKDLEFWDYSFKLVVNAIISIIFMQVISLGLFIALIILESLFGVDINEKINWTIFSFASIVAISTFLILFPTKIYNKIDEIKYPAFLKSLVSYILLPLTAIYLMILYVYLFKIIITWSIPAGSVSYMVMIFSMFGIFALLMIFPLQKEGTSKWINIFAKYFYFAMLPLIVLLFIAIEKRIVQYGITENRYYVLIYAIWLIVIIFYMIINKFKKIIFIPMSFIVVFFLSSFGPQSAFNISKHSQLNRIDKIIKEYNILQDTTTEIPDSVFNDLLDIIVYYTENHDGKDIFEKYGFAYNDSLFENHSSYIIRQAIIDSLNINKPIGNIDYENSYFYFSSKFDNFLDISEYEYMFDYDSYKTYNALFSDFSFNTSSYTCMIKHDKFMIFNFNDEFSNLIKKYDESKNNNDSLIIFSKVDNKGNKCTIFVREFSGYQGEETIINHLYCTFLFSFSE
jgi:hypothetical protein